MVSEKPSGFIVNGRMLTEAELDAMPSRLQEICDSHDAPGGSRPSCWPMRSNCLGINPEQIQEQMQADKEAGLNLSYDEKTGECIVPSQSEFKKACVANGQYHRQAGYSDATPDDIPKDETDAMLDDAVSENDWEDPDA